MKRITIAEKKEEVVVDSFDQMLKEFLYIGFQPEDKDYRYMIVTGGPLKGLAVNSECNWSDKDKQREEKGTYYTFDSKAELYEWMSEE